MPTPQELFKQHCKSNATFKQYETFAQGYELGRNDPYPHLAAATGDNSHTTDAEAKYNNAVSAFKRISDNYKRAEDQISEAITILSLVHNSLPDGHQLKVLVAEFLTKGE